MIELYLLLALSVGVWACVEYIPRIRKTLFERNKLDDPLYDSPFILFFVLLLVSTILAPIVFLTLFSEKLRNSAVASMLGDKV